MNECHCQEERREEERKNPLPHESESSHPDCFNIVVIVRDLKHIANNLRSHKVQLTSHDGKIKAARGKRRKRKEEKEKKKKKKKKKERKKGKEKEKRRKRKKKKEKEEKK